MFETKLMIHIIHWIKELTHPFFLDCLMTRTRNCQIKYSTVKDERTSNMSKKKKKKSHSILSWKVNAAQEGCSFLLPLNMIKIKLFILESLDPCDWKMIRNICLDLMWKCRAKCWILIFLLCLPSGEKWKIYTTSHKLINLFFTISDTFSNCFAISSLKQKCGVRLGTSSIQIFVVFCQHTQVMSLLEFSPKPHICLPETCTEFRTWQIKCCRV